MRVAFFDPRSLGLLRTFQYYKGCRDYRRGRGLDKGILGKPAQLDVFDPTTHQIFHPRKARGYVTDEIGNNFGYPLYRKGKATAPVADYFEAGGDCASQSRF